MAETSLNASIKNTRVKKTLFSYALSFVLTLMVLATPFYVNSVFSRNNYNHNLTVQQKFTPFLHKNFINQQWQTSDFKYGASTSDKNGCGWIAIYNVSNMLGLPLSIADIISEIDVYGTSTFGYLGTNPIIFKKYFEKRNYVVDFVFDYEKFDESVRNSDASILCYFSLKGGHATTVRPYNSTKLEFFNNHYIKSMDEFLQTVTDRVVFVVTINRAI
jgi:hypothetical protein